MNAAFRDRLRSELASRGFTPAGDSPNRTMTLDETYLDAVELGDLMETVVARREKVFSSQSVVGHDAARQSYEDVILVVDAIKAVMKALTLA